MEKILIIDGHCLLFQSFYGMQTKLFAKTGERIETVICFIGLLRKTINMVNPTHIYIVFDGEIKHNRQSIYSEYKANRQSYNGIDNPFEQLKTIKKILSFYNINYYETVDCEADDYIAGLVKYILKKYKDIEIIISSHDKDFLQLINNKTTILSYRGKSSKLWTYQQFIHTFGFSPEKYITYKSLIGDKSDNIIGIKGIGHITAVKLIQQFSDIFAIINNYQPKKVSREQFVKIALLNHSLISLNNLPPKDIDLKKCQINFEISNFTYKNIFRVLKIEF